MLLFISGSGAGGFGGPSLGSPQNSCSLGLPPHRQPLPSSRSSRPGLSGRIRRGKRPATLLIVLAATPLVPRTRPQGWHRGDSSCAAPAPVPVLLILSVPAQHEARSGDGTRHPFTAPGLGLSVPSWLPTVGTVNTPKPRGCCLCTTRCGRGKVDFSLGYTASGREAVGNRPVPIDVGTVVALGSLDVRSGARPHRGHAGVTPFALVLAWPAGRNRGLTHRGWALPVPPSFRRSPGPSAWPRTGSTTGTGSPRRRFRRLVAAGPPEPRVFG